MAEAWFSSLSAWGMALTAVQQEQFARYEALLLDWNQRFNLTAVRDPAQIRSRHFVDSLSCVSALGVLNGRSLIDVGTGAGFPGLPLKIAFPDLRLTLVESVTKKTRFLTAVVSDLGLTDVQIITARAETIGQDLAHREQYDYVVARAVAELRVLVEYLLPLCRVGGLVLAQKGVQAEAEVAVAQTAVAQLGGGEPQLHPITFAAEETPHYLVTIPKLTATPPEYPRRAGLPTKRPL